VMLPHYSQVLHRHKQLPAVPTAPLATGAALALPFKRCLGLPRT
jgi:hypothetical protein